MSNMSDWLTDRIKRFEQDMAATNAMHQHAAKCDKCKPEPLFLCEEALKIGGETARRHYAEMKCEQANRN